MKYGPEIRQQARQAFEQGGTFLASRRTGVAPRTIREWAQQGQWRAAAASGADGTARSAAMQAGWVLRRRGLADEAGVAAAELLTMLRERVHARKVYGIRDLAMAFAAMVDKAETITASLGTQGLDARPEKEVREHVTSLLTLWAEREKAANG